MRVTWTEGAGHLARVEPRLAPLVAAAGPPSFVLERDRFRALAESIFYQQVAGAAAAAIGRKVRAHYGRFPGPGEVLATPPARLRSFGLSRQKASYVRGLAEAVAEGRVDLRRLARAPDGEVVEALTELKGIGPWTAQMFLIFSLGRPDVWPVGDYGVQKGVQRLLGQKSLPARSRMERVAEPWRPYRSAAAWYMWRSLDAGAPGLPPARRAAPAPAAARGPRAEQGGARWQ